MRDLRHIATFATGETVPDWLLTVEPQGTASVPGTLTFRLAADIYSDGTRYLVWPTGHWAGDIIRIDDARDVNVLALTQRVYLPHGFTVLSPPKGAA